MFTYAGLWSSSYPIRPSAGLPGEGSLVAAALCDVPRFAQVDLRQDCRSIGGSWGQSLHFGRDYLPYTQPAGGALDATIRARFSQCSLSTTSIPSWHIRVERRHKGACSDGQHLQATERPRLWASRPTGRSNTATCTRYKRRRAGAPLTGTNLYGFSCKQSLLIRSIPHIQPGQHGGPLGTGGGVFAHYTGRPFLPAVSATSSNPPI